MNRRCYLILLMLGSLGITDFTWAQTVVDRSEMPLLFDASQARFEHLTVADGLPENSGLALLQDHLGFIWIGTQNGLARYDGQTMTTFEVDLDDPYSFAGQVVTVLEEDHVGDLWIGTFGSGLIHYERATGRFTTYVHDPADAASLSSNWIYFLHADQRGNIWVGVGERLPFKLDRLNRAVLQDRTPASLATNAPPLFTRIRHNPDVPGTISDDLIGAFQMNATDVNEAFLEDDAGTIWVGTIQGGLNRYDPETETFKAYRHDANNSNSLGSNDVRSVVQDREGDLWIGTIAGGLSRFDPTTESFTHYRHDPDTPQSLASDNVFSVYEDLSGALWLSTDVGLSQYNPRTMSFTHFPTDRERPGAPREDYLYPIDEDLAGIWFLSRDSGDQEAALHYYDKATQSFTYIVHDPDDPTSLSRFPFSFLRDRSGTIWVGSGMQGVNKLDTRPRFPLYTHIPDDPNSPSHSRIFVVYEPPSEPGILWIGTEAGLDRWDRTTGQYTHYRHRPGNPQSLARGWVNGIVEDQEGQFWVKTFNGIQLMDRTTGRFTSFNHSVTGSSDLSALTAARDGTLWIAGDGLTRLDPQTGDVKNYRALEGSSYHPDLYAVLRVREEDGHRVAALLQVGDDADLTQAFSLEAPTALLVVAMAECMGNPCADRGWVEDEAGQTVWEMPSQGHRHAGGNVKNRVQAEILQVAAGTYRLRYRSDENHSYAAWNAAAPIYAAHWGIEVQRVPEMEVDSLDALLQKPNDEGLSGNLTSSIYEDRHGNLWVGTFLNGLNRFDPETETFVSFFDPRIGPQSVRSLYEDRSGRLWMADGSKGLHLIDPERGSIQQYTVRDGLPSNIIMSITEDDAGKLWLGTGNGIVRFDPDLATSSDIAPQFRTYGAAYGLQQEALSSSAIKSADGTLFFAGQGGVHAVYPTRMVDDPSPPEVALTGFDLFNTPAPIGSDAPLATDVSIAETIRLTHDENDFTFHFAALHYTRPEENTVAYKLEPYEDDWVDGGAVRAARYTNLSPGTYTFRVKAASPDGVWNEEGRSIRVEVLPPWWRTTWAYLLYGLLFAGGVFGVDRIQRQRVIAQERERTRERDLKQAREIEQAYTQLKATQSQLVQQEKMASLGQLTAGIAHEIKNPLNFINNFAEVNEELADELHEELADHPQALAVIEDLLADLKQNASVIAQHGKRADGIVKSMMAHARSGSSEKRAVDLNALIAEHIDLAYHGKRATVPGFTVEVVRDFGLDVGEAHVVPQDMGRVVLNLLSNAFDAMLDAHTPEPCVTVSTRRGPHEVEVRVADNGPGMTEDIKTKVFEPFFTTKPTGQGTGLGLSMSYDIITQGHSGTMRVESKRGKGTVFIIQLPYALATGGAS